LLPFDREVPGAWQRWENFWVDFLNAGVLLPWPGGNGLFKRVECAEKYGLQGGSQDGIDVRAFMDDGSILAVQCKNRLRFAPDKARKAMDKAEKEFADAQAYLLVLTQSDVSADIQNEADRRGNWLVIGRDTLSSWFFAGKCLPVGEQKRLIRTHFGDEWVRELFPLPGDKLLITAAEFFEKKNLISHRASLQGEVGKKMASDLANALATATPRVAILVGPGGGGKSRMLKAVADEFAQLHEGGRIFFQNDDADVLAEEYSLRGESLDEAAVVIDDAHRLENLRPRMLKELQRAKGAALLIAARPNAVEALKRILLDAGFRETDWERYELPELGYEDRKAIAVELLGGESDEFAHELAIQSKGCPLICTVGAELFKAGVIERDLKNSPDFKRRVFDHLVESSLNALFETESLKKELAEKVLRVIAMLAPIEMGGEFNRRIAELLRCQPWDVDRMIPELTDAGLLRITRGKIRVVPDLLADHLVYDTAHGARRMPSLVREVIDVSGLDSFASLFGNLAEAEWRARQEGCSENYLEGMWEGVREMLHDPEELRIFSLLDAWRKFAVFQPERTLELARIILDHETARVASGLPELNYQGFRYDSIAMHLGKLPELLVPVARQHAGPLRMEAFDLLWEIGCIKQGGSPDDLPTAWAGIASTASLACWEDDGPRETFEWLKKWVRSQSGKAALRSANPLLAGIAAQWMGARSGRSWKEVEVVREHSEEIALFQYKVLEWMDDEVVSVDELPCWSALPVIFAAGERWTRAFTQPGEPERTSLETRSIEMLLGILSKYPNSVIGLAIWRHSSRRAAQEGSGEMKAAWLSVRDSIPKDLAFQLVRLACGFAIHEWNHERLQKWEAHTDYEAAGNWWSELTCETIRELRRKHPSIGESLGQIDDASRALSKFRQRSMWDLVAEAWSRQFSEDRDAVLNELLVNPERALVPCLGYFLGLRGELDCDFAEMNTLRALSHADARVRRATLSRLSWRDVTRRDSIAAKLREMAAGSDSSIVSEMVGFIARNRYEATPYFEEVLCALNAGILSCEDLASLGDALANALEYSGLAIETGGLKAYFDRLCDEEGDLLRVFPEHVMGIFHRKYPAEMFRVYLQRARAGRMLPCFIEGWLLGELGGHPEFESMAEEVFGEAVRSTDERFHSYRELFDAAVGRVDPSLAAHLLSAELGRAPIERIIELTGCGHGSVVYHEPEFTKRLLTAIHGLPRRRSKELLEELIYAAVPHSWGMTGGEVNEEYLWARDGAAKMVEEHRADPELRDFYSAIQKNQEELVARERRRFQELE
jgi:hypothetical protein